MKLQNSDIIKLVTLCRKKREKKIIKKKNEIVKLQKLLLHNCATTNIELTATCNLKLVKKNIF